MAVSGGALQKIAMDNLVLKQTLVTFQTSQGVDLHGTLIRSSKHQVVFEVYNCPTILRLSEVLESFKVTVDDHLIYGGRATITSLLNSGLALVCEVGLEDVWFNPEAQLVGVTPDQAGLEFDGFFREWQKHFLIDREYRLFVSELFSFFHDLRLWLEHVELGVRAAPQGDGHRLQQDLAQQAAPGALKVFQSFVDRFEPIAARLQPELVPAHQVYMRRQLHSLVLCAPWVYRTIVKPLGYAGDYEMVNMMVGDPLQGASLFAKVVNYCFINQNAVVAHRNRINYLVEQLKDEALRLVNANRPFRVLSIGCGPALELQRFVAQSPLAKNASFDLLDFNEETLQYVSQALASAGHRHGHGAVAMRTIRKSVFQLVKDGARSTQGSAASQYDFVYCAGLFDYLTDQVCRRLISLAADWLAPGGLLSVTNVSPENPSRYGMEHMLDWNLVYRDARQMRNLVPDHWSEPSKVFSDPTGVNLWVEMRRPGNG